MTLYRTSGKTREPADLPPPDDDRVILWLALVISLLGLLPRIGSSEAWGAEPSLALIIAVGSASQLAREAWKAFRRRRRSRISLRAALRDNRRTGHK
jgi:hypothetical protein